MGKDPIGVYTTAKFTIIKDFYRCNNMLWMEHTYFADDYYINHNQFLATKLK